MDKAPIVYAFLDTNFFIHYKSFREVEWLKELAAKKVCLVVAPTVHHELDKLKDDKANGRRRDRSRSTLAEFTRMGLKEILQGANVRDSGRVTLRVLVDYPDMSVFSRLQKGYPDDEIIATALTFQKTCDPGDEVVIVTGDGPLRLKAYASGLRIFDPDHLKSKDEKDDATRRIEELEKENRRLQHAEPQMVVEFVTETESTKILHITRQVVTTWNQQEYDNRVAEEAVAIKADLSNGTDLPTLEEVSIEVEKMHDPDYMEAVYALEKRIEAKRLFFSKEYQEKAQSYLTAYSKYLRDAFAYADERTRAYTIRLSAINSGTKAAEDIFIAITFPHGFTLCDKDDLLDRVSKEDRPPRPKPPTTKYNPYNAFNLAYLRTGLMSPSLPYIGPFRSNIVSSDKKYVGPFFNQKRPNQATYEFARLIHGTSLALNSFVCIFPREWEDRTIPVNYRINIGNKVHPIYGNLEIVVDDMVQTNALLFVESKERNDTDSRRTS